MDAPDSVFIVARPFLHGSRELLCGDRYDHLALGLPDAIDRMFRKNGFVVALTRESYRALIARRPSGTLGDGFTAEFLRGRGIIDEQESVDHARFPDGSEWYRGYLIVRRKAGGFKLFEVLNAAHEPMREKRFHSTEFAKEFVDTLPEVKEQGDVVHVRPGTVDGHQPHSATAG